jgi:isoleucyl-tRNA synthetase
VACILRVRTQVNEAIEPLRAAGKLGKSLDAMVTLAANPADAVGATLARHQATLPELFIVSEVSVTKAAPDSPLTIAVRPSAEEGRQRCPRCWRWVAVLQPAGTDNVCPRCAEALHA